MTASPRTFTSHCHGVVGAPKGRDASRSRNSLVERRIVAAPPSALNEVDATTEFSVAIGYAGLAMMGLQFGLTARFRYVTEPWGEDVIYHFHRQISLVAVGLIVTHAVILTAGRPDML